MKNLGRIPAALIVAFAVSLGLHVALLFGPDVELASEPDPVPLVAKIQPSSPPVHPSRPKRDVKPKAPSKPKRRIVEKSIPSVSPESQAPSVMTAPEASQGAPAVPNQTGQVGSRASDTSSHAGSVNEKEAASSEEAPLPASGSIQYRVDHGDSEFEIGVANQTWEIRDGHYRLHSIVQTTGLARLLRTVLIEMESLGQLSDQGLKPEVFGVRRGGKKAKEKALFDWESMKIRVADRPDQTLIGGAQDLLSFYYQLRFMDLSQPYFDLPVATGKKFSVYRLENLGEESIETPMGTMRSLHVRAQSDSTTELWLAYDYRMLPVKIRFVDNKGSVLVQVATHIQFGN